MFNGMDATQIDVQVQLSAGLAKPEFNIIGLADRAVKESAERIRNVLSALNLSLPPKRLTVNLSPADVEKSGSHFDLPILCGILCAIGILPEEQLSRYIIIGEVGLNGAILKTDSVLPTSVWANNNNLGVICPGEQGGEARWAGHTNILAPFHVLELINHFKVDTVSLLVYDAFCKVDTVSLINLNQRNDSLCLHLHLNIYLKKRKTQLFSPYSMNFQKYL